VVELAALLLLLAWGTKGKKWCSGQCQGSPGRALGPEPIGTPAHRRRTAATWRPGRHTGRARHAQGER
jgi:hypothetical protein